MPLTWYAFIATTVAALLPAPTFTATEITWEPSQPIQGSIIQFRVRPQSAKWAGESVISMRGTLGAEPIYFDLGGDGAFTALGGIPITAGDSVPLVLFFDYQNGTSRSIEIGVPVRRGRFPMERLRVSSQFSTPPSPALRRRIARERARSRAAWQQSYSTPRLWEAPFVRPRPTRITSAFGVGRVFNGRIRSRHMGTDLDGNTGDPVIAANRGVVRLTGEFYYGGNLVYLDHGRGLVTAYLHLSEITVAEGDLVDRGQVIGKVGATGRVTGPHLHWIARYGGVTTNPISLLALGTDATETSRALPD